MTMMRGSSSTISSSLVLLVCLSLCRSTLAQASLWSKTLSCFQCPTSVIYDPECLASALPPWPICLFHDVESFVEKAKDGATRCCGDDLSECRCPKKDDPKFLQKIGDWCEGVQKCMPCVEGDEGCLGNSKTQTLSLEEETSPLENEESEEDEEEEDLLSPDDHPYDKQVERELFAGGECPTDSKYSAKCLSSSIPPYPICTKKTAEEWVEHAKKGYTDCCGDDMSNCSCPKKDSDKFAGRIGDWCAGVETCDDHDSDTEKEGELKLALTMEGMGHLRASTERLMVPKNEEP